MFLVFDNQTYNNAYVQCPTYCLCIIIINKNNWRIQKQYLKNVYTHIYYYKTNEVYFLV